MKTLTILDSIAVQYIVVEYNAVVQQCNTIPTRVECSVVDGAVFEQREGLSVVVVGPETHEDAGCAAQDGHRIAQEGVIWVDEEPVLLSVHLE